MLPTNTQVIDEGFIDDLSKQLYNTSKILYCLREEEKEKVIRQLVKDFLKPYIKTKENVITEKS